MTEFPGPSGLVADIHLHEARRPLGVAVASVAIQLAGAWLGFWSVAIGLFGPNAHVFGARVGDIMPFPPVVTRAAVLWTALGTLLGSLALGGVGYAMGRGHRWTLVLGVAALLAGVLLALFGLPGAIVVLLVELVALAYFARPTVRAWFAAQA